VRPLSSSLLFAPRYARKVYVKQTTDSPSSDTLTQKLRACIEVVALGVYEENVRSEADICRSKYLE